MLLTMIMTRNDSFYACDDASDSASYDPYEQNMLLMMMADWAIRMMMATDAGPGRTEQTDPVVQNDRICSS